MYIGSVTKWTSRENSFHYALKARQCGILLFIYRFTSDFIIADAEIVKHAPPWLTEDKNKIDRSVSSTVQSDPYRQNSISAG